MGKHIHQTRSKMNWKSALALTGILALCIPAQGHVLHVDIEPHSLPALWANHKPEISGQWLDLLTSMKSRINDESMNGDANHILKADVAMSYAMSETSMAYKGKTAVLLEHTFDICDGAVLMAYRAFDGVSRESCEFIGNQDLNRADDLSGGLCDPSKCPGQDNVLTHSVEAVKIGQRVASDKGLKKLGIALEVNPDVNARITMGALEEGEAALERAIDDVTPLLANTLVDRTQLDLSIGVHDMTNYMARMFIDPDPNAVVPSDALSADVASNQATGSTGRYCRFAWLWDEIFVTSFCDSTVATPGMPPAPCDTAQKMDKKNKRQQMWTFTREHGITVLVLQVVHLVDANNKENLKRFVLEAYANDVGIEFMFAGHHYAKQEEHEGVMTQVDKLLAFLKNDLGPQPASVSLNHDGSCKNPNHEENLDQVVLPKYDWAKDATCGFLEGENDDWRISTDFTRSNTPAGACEDATASNPQGRCNELIGYLKTHVLQQGSIGAFYTDEGLDASSSRTQVQAFLYDFEPKWNCLRPCPEAVLLSTSNEGSSNEESTLKDLHIQDTVVPETDFSKI